MRVLRENTVSWRPGYFLAAIALLAGLLLPCRSQAAVAVLLEQPYGKLNIINPAGHAAIYLNHICAETPLQLRPCRAGEMGVVISRYDGIGDHDWIAMPLLPYLYAVDSLAEIPDRIDRAGEDRLRNIYRREHLQLVAPDLPNGDAPPGNWYELVGGSFDRTMYGFQVETTPAQNAHLISVFNDQRNTERYNGAFRNCADFARVVVDMFYPHAIRRNYVADLGVTTPKTVARGLAHYASRHPETHFRAFMIPQVKGDLPRSHLNTSVTEGILKRYSLPLVVLSPATTAVVLAAYIGEGRFAMPKDAEVLDLADLPAEDTDSDITRPFQPAAPRLPAPAVMVQNSVQRPRLGANVPSAELIAARGDSPATPTALPGNLQK
jgi:hypothetical protein